MAMCLGHARRAHSSLFSKLAIQTFVPFWGEGRAYAWTSLFPDDVPPRGNLGGEMVGRRSLTGRMPATQATGGMAATPATGECQPHWRQGGSSHTEHRGNASHTSQRGMAWFLLVAGVAGTPLLPVRLGPPARVWLASPFGWCGWHSPGGRCGWSPPVAGVAGIPLWLVWLPFPLWPVWLEIEAERMSHQDLTRRERNPGNPYRVDLKQNPRLKSPQNFLSESSASQLPLNLRKNCLGPHCVTAPPNFT